MINENLKNLGVDALKEELERMSTVSTVDESQKILVSNALNSLLTESELGE